MVVELNTFAIIKSKINVFFFFQNIYYFINWLTLKGIKLLSYLNNNKIKENLNSYSNNRLNTFWASCECSQNRKLIRSNMQTMRIYL